MKILRCGLTDGPTDEAGYIGPAEGNGGSKKHLERTCQPQILNIHAAEKFLCQS